jgi:hypothetical protein
VQELVSNEIYDDQIEEVEGTTITQRLATDKDSEKASRTALFDDSADNLLGDIATSNEVNETSDSFAISPLRAKLSTVTLVELYKVTP